jgi:chemotaxis protein methyltransferase CheR
MAAISKNSAGRSVKPFAGEFSVACEESFCKQIAQRTGIVLQDHQLVNLRDTIRNGCARFEYTDPAQYLHALQTSTGLTEPLEYLIAGITVGESYFFRDSEQIELLRDALLPEMIAAKRVHGDLSLRIWSAGCSQGQEIYTIALMLHELLPDIAQWRIHLLGTDINSEVVAKAIRGRYSDWSFRATPPELRDRWFTRAGNEYEIRTDVKRMVHFAYLNLTEDVYPSILSETNAMDIILCRNVFIYLERKAVQRSMSQYAECLVERGALILGASDPVEYTHTPLKWVQNGRAAYFRKEPYSSPVSNEYRTPELARDFTPATNKMPQALTRRIEKPITQPKSIPPVRTYDSGKRIAAANVEKSATGMAEIIKSLKCSDWSSALVKIEEACVQGKGTSDLWQMKANALANLGQMDRALQACATSLQMEVDNKHTYLIQGLILAELNREQDAEQALRKALYLDHSFLEAHYELGMLRVRASDLRGAIKSMENALKLALEGDPERELHNAGGMTYHRFAQVLKNEIGTLQNVAAGKKPRKLSSLQG